ncbi:hypothetical protein N7450_001979 [Penicillium hetheringtonii]|nr:hypothetical protein N7450_001979 [Penicillium hetheringtonii]
MKAWLVASGAACIFFSALGFANSFGVFMEYYLSHQLRDQSADKVAWIGSVAVFMQFATGMVGGPLFDRYGAWVIRPSAVLLVFAIMMTSLCKEYWQFMLSQGILLGVSMGLVQFPAMAAVTQYFDKKSGAALGLVISGSSIGGVVIPIALSKMLNGTNFGFGWSIRIIGFVLIPLLAFSCITVRSRLPPRKSAFLLPSAFKDPKYCLLIAALFFMFIGMFAPLFYMPTYAVERGMNPTLASYLLAIINGASTFGRVVPGVLADRFGRLNVFIFGGFASGIVVCCMNLAKSTAVLVVYSTIVGFTTGTIISGGSTALTLCITTRQNSGTLLGMGLGLSSVASLIGPPVNGAFVQHYHGFSQMSMFSGVMCLAGGFIAFAAKSTTPQGIFGQT